MKEGRRQKTREQDNREKERDTKRGWGNPGQCVAEPFYRSFSNDLAVALQLH